MSTELRQRAARWTDWFIVLALGGSALYKIWAHPLLDDGIPGPRLANTFLFLLIAVPFAFRRRWPVLQRFALLLDHPHRQCMLLIERTS